MPTFAITPLFQRAQHLVYMAKKIYVYENWQSAVIMPYSYESAYQRPFYFKRYDVFAQQ